MIHCDWNLYVIVYLIKQYTLTVGIINVKTFSKCHREQKKFNNVLTKYWVKNDRFK